MFDQHFAFYALMVTIFIMALITVSSTKKKTRQKRSSLGTSASANSTARSSREHDDLSTRVYKAEGFSGCGSSDYSGGSSSSSSSSCD